MRRVPVGGTEAFMALRQVNVPWKDLTWTAGKLTCAAAFDSVGLAAGCRRRRIFHA